MMSLWRTYGADFKANLKLAWPIILGQLGQISVNIIDNLMVGTLGKIALAAVSVAISVFVIFLVVGVGISMALQPLVAEADVKGEKRTISFSVKHSLLINLSFAIFSVLAVELSIPFLSRFGLDPMVLCEAIPYLRICVWSLVPMMVFQGLKGLWEGLSSTRVPMLAMLIGNVVNVIMNYLLIFGSYGAPELGVDGAAWGTLIARLVMLIVILIFSFNAIGRKMEIRRYLMAMDLKKYSLTFFRKVLRLGVPTSLQMLFEVGAFAAAALMMGLISPAAQAAHQITINAVSATFMVCVGLSVAATIRVGNGLGLDDISHMRRAGLVAMVQAFGFMAFTGVLISYLRFIIPSLYIDDAEVIEIASGLFLVAALFQISDGVQVAAIGALRGMQDIWWPTAITFVAYIIIGLPLSWLSAFHWGHGYWGIWAGLLIGLTISAVANSWRFLRLTQA